MQMHPLLHREPGCGIPTEVPSWMTACIPYGRMTSHGESGQCSCVSEELVTSTESICNVSNQLFAWVFNNPNVKQAVTTVAAVLLHPCAKVLVRCWSNLIAINDRVTSCSA